MNPIRSIDEVLKHWSIFEEKWKAVYAFFLYTNEDKQIAKHIREYFTDLHILSGDECLIFLIDKPPKKWEERKEIKDYWKEFKFKTSIWEGFTEVVPYDRSKSYEIADFFGISPKVIPCIVFFKNIDETDFLIFPLKDNWNEEKLKIKLREVFSAMKMKAGHIDNENERKEQIWGNLKKYIRSEYREQKITGIIIHPITKSIGELFKYILLN